MAPSRKRSIDEVDDGEIADAVPELVAKLRNMWQFANLSQWIYLFGKVAKIDDRVDIEVRLPVVLLFFIKPLTSVFDA